jgi:SnoaL-like domain
MRASLERLSGGLLLRVAAIGRGRAGQKTSEVSAVGKGSPPLVRGQKACGERSIARGRGVGHPLLVFTPRTFEERHTSATKYQATTHFVGQNTVFTLTGRQATGEAYCLAHHVPVNGEKRRLMVASLRYYDTFVKIEGVSLFAERLLCVDWMDERAVS